MSKIVIDICLSDIDVSRVKNASNGKKYIKLDVCDRRQVDQFGNTHYVEIHRFKEDIQAGVEKVYCGTGKEYKYSGATNASNAPAGNAVDLCGTPVTEDEPPF